MICFLIRFLFSFFFQFYTQFISITFNGFMSNNSFLFLNKESMYWESNCGSVMSYIKILSRSLFCFFAFFFRIDPKRWKLKCNEGWSGEEREKGIYGKGVGYEYKSFWNNRMCRRFGKILLRTILNSFQMIFSIKI